MLLGFAVTRQFRDFRNETRIKTSRDTNYDVARLLSHYSRRHYTLATTEAGLLPLYSGWRSIDMWGLNDAWIAHHGGITEDYLAKVQPHVLIFHAGYNPEHPRELPATETWVTLGIAWSAMVQLANQYYKFYNYDLINFIVYENGSYYYYYYVRRDFPDSIPISQYLHEYFHDHPH